MRRWFLWRGGTHYFGLIEIYNWVASFLPTAAHSKSVVRLRPIDKTLETKWLVIWKIWKSTLLFMRPLLAKMQGYLCMWDKIIIFPGWIPPRPLLLFEFFSHVPPSFDLILCRGKEKELRYFFFYEAKCPAVLTVIYIEITIDCRRAVLLYVLLFHGTTSGSWSYTKLDMVLGGCNHC